MKLIHNYSAVSEKEVLRRKMTHTQIIRNIANSDYGKGSRAEAIINFIDKEVISDAEVHLLCRNEEHRLEEYKSNAQNTQAVKRDNKGVYIGTGYSSNPTKVRYPSKKRSLQTWKKFYEMFPHQAELDGWDGKKSSRYDGKK